MCGNKVGRHIFLSSWSWKLRFRFVRLQTSNLLGFLLPKSLLKIQKFMSLRWKKCLLRWHQTLKWQDALYISPKLFPFDKHLIKLPPFVATVSSDPSAPEISTHPVMFVQQSDQTVGFIFTHYLSSHHTSLPLPQIWLKVWKLVSWIKWKNSA